MLYPPIGMAYVASYLRNSGYEVKQLDLAAEKRLDLRTTLGLAECSRTSGVMLKIFFKDEYPVSTEELHQDLMTPEVRHVSILPSDFGIQDVDNVIKLIPNLTDSCVHGIRQAKAEVVGFHVVWDSALMSLLIAKKLKEIDPDLLIIFGGPDCSNLFRGGLFSRLGLVDAVAIGEGERTSKELLDQWEKSNGDLRNIKVRGCIINVKGKEVLDHGEPDLISDLDGLPFPDYSDLPLRKYTGFYALPILTSRGCEYKCKFCVDRLAICQETYRERSIGNVVEEVLHLYEKYDVKGLYFCDSSLNASLLRLTSLCDGLMKVKKKVGKTLYWGGDIRVSPITQGIMKRMYEAGCRFLMFGAESASQRILKAMGKGVTVEEMTKAFNWAKEAGIWVFTYWIVGYPGEEEKDLLYSMRFAQENCSNIDEACIASCEVGVGSELYRRRRELGIQILESQIQLNEKLRLFKRYIGGYKAWRERSTKNTPMERMHRRVIFEAFTRSLGYPSNWAIWPPMLPIDKLDASDFPVADEYAVQRIEHKLGGEEIYVIPTTTMEPKRISASQLEILKLCDGNRSVQEISSIIRERIRDNRAMQEVLEDCSRFLADTVRLEIVRLSR
nr:radical SAM protein [Candidatus Njordarchaeum guaymaensis]